MHFGESHYWSEAPFLPPREPPGPLWERNLFFWDPPGPSQDQLWSLRGRPRSSQDGPGAPKGRLKFTKWTCSKPWKYHYLASRELKKVLPVNFLTSPERSGDLQNAYPDRQERLGVPQKPPGTGPGPSKKLPGPPWSHPGRSQRPSHDLQGSPGTPR